MSINIIDEDLARSAKNANSFRDYKAGSETAKYNSHVSSFKQQVNELIKKNPERYKANKDKIDSLMERHSKKLANAINEKNRIDARMPSVMIAGAGNFPTRKKEKQNTSRENWFKENSHLFDDDKNYYLNRIKSTLNNNAIFSDEVDADKQLEIKISKLKKEQDEMKEANAYYRKNKTMKGYKDFSIEDTAEMDKKLESSIYKTPYPSFSLTNNNANIRRLESRLKNIKKTKIKPKASHKVVKDFEIVENTDLMRLQILFNGKPDESTREQLKKRGFKWSPTSKAWQRQLTENARRSTKWFVEDYLKLNPSAAAEPKQKAVVKKDAVKKGTASSYEQLKNKGSLKPKKRKKQVEKSVEFILEENKMPDESLSVFRPYRRTKSGKIIYAKDYGKKVFRFSQN